MYTSTTLVKPSNVEFQTCSRIMVRVTGRLTLRTRYSSRRNSLGRRLIASPDRAIYVAVVSHESTSSGALPGPSR
jgi:hypothetical protein